VPDKPVIVNNTPLVAFWAIGRLDILRSLFDEILIPAAVRDEFLATEKESRRRTLREESWIRVVEVQNPRRTQSFVGLDTGETEVLVLAEEQGASLVLIDERKARRFAERMGLPLSGTLGVLLLAKEEKIISAIAPILQKIQEAGLYFHSELIERVLQLAGEK
jgi:predicted nucleic acid-binding protein